MYVSTYFVGYPMSSMIEVIWIGSMYLHPAAVVATGLGVVGAALTVGCLAMARAENPDPLPSHATPPVAHIIQERN